MALPLAIPLVAGGIGAAGALFESFRSGPDFGQMRQDLIQQNQLRQGQAIGRSTSDTRARLASQGIGGGSGVINRIISDQNARIFGQFETSRQQGLAQLQQQEIASGQQRSQQRAQAFGQLGGLGIQAFSAFGGGAGQSQGLQQLQQTQQFGLENLQNIFNIQGAESQFQNPVNLGQQQQFNPQLQGAFG